VQCFNSLILASLVIVKIKMVNGSGYYRVFESVSIASALSSAYH